MPIYNSYVSGEEYYFNPMALELKKFVTLPRAEFLEKRQELLKKYENKLEAD